VDAEDVIQVLDALDAAGVRHWVAGGWGIAALVGRQTRQHRDLDLAVDAADLSRCLAVLAGLEYAAETDWLPSRIELRAAGERWVDVHPVAFSETGVGRQADLDGGSTTSPNSTRCTEGRGRLAASRRNCRRAAGPALVRRACAWTRPVLCAQWCD
jgi:lincosamide nucleotidyltransferase A/C/D/E